MYILYITSYCGPLQRLFKSCPWSRLSRSITQMSDLGQSFFGYTLTLKPYLKYLIFIDIAIFIYHTIFARWSGYFIFFICDCTLWSEQCLLFVYILTYSIASSDCGEARANDGLQQNIPSSYSTVNIQWPSTSICLL